MATHTSDSQAVHSEKVTLLLWSGLVYTVVIFIDVCCEVVNSVLYIFVVFLIHNIIVSFVVSHNSTHISIVCTMYCKDFDDSKIYVFNIVVSNKMLTLNCKLVHSCLWQFHMKSLSVLNTPVGPLGQSWDRWGWDHLKQTWSDLTYLIAVSLFELWELSFTNTTVIKGIINFVHPTLMPNTRRKQKNMGKNYLTHVEVILGIHNECNYRNA